MPDNRITSSTLERPAMAATSVPPFSLATTSIATTSAPNFELQNVNNRVITLPRSFSPARMPNRLPRNERVERGNGEYSGTAQTRIDMPNWQNSLHPGAFTPTTSQATAMVLPHTSFETDTQHIEREFQRDSQTGQILLYSDSLRMHFDHLLNTTQMYRSGLSQTAKNTANALTFKVNNVLDLLQDNAALLRSTRLLEMKETVHKMVYSFFHDNSEVEIPSSLLDASESLAKISLAMQNLTTQEGEILARHKVERKKIQGPLDSALEFPGTGTERYELVKKRSSLEKDVERKLFNNSALIASRLLFIMTNVDLSLYKRYDQALMLCQQFDTSSHLLSLFRLMMEQTGFYAAVDRLRVTLPSRPVVDNIQILADDLGKAFKKERNIQAGLTYLEISRAIGSWLTKVSDHEKVFRDQTLNWRKEEELSEKYQQRAFMLIEEKARMEMRQEERLWAEEKISVDINVHTAEYRSLEGNNEHQAAMTGLGTSTVQVKVPREELYKYWEKESKGAHSQSTQMIQEWVKQKQAFVPSFDAQGYYRDAETGENYGVQITRQVNAITAAPTCASLGYNQNSIQDALKETVEALHLTGSMPASIARAAISLPLPPRPERLIAQYNAGALSARSRGYQPPETHVEIFQPSYRQLPSFSSTFNEISARAPVFNPINNPAHSIVPNLPFPTMAQQTSRTDKELQSLFNDIKIAETRSARDLFFGIGATNPIPLPNFPLNPVSAPPLPQTTPLRAFERHVPNTHAYRGRNDTWEEYMQCEQQAQIKHRGVSVYNSLPNLRPAIILLNKIVTDVYHQIINPHTFAQVRQALAYCTGIPPERITGDIYHDFSRQICSLRQQIRTFLSGGENENQWVIIKTPEESPIFAATMPTDPECRIWLSQFVASYTLPKLIMTLTHEFSHMSALAKPTEDYLYVTSESYNSYNIEDINALTRSLLDEVSAMANNTGLRAEYIQQTKDNAGENYCLAELANTFGVSSAKGAARAVEKDDRLRYELIQGTADLLMLTILKLGNKVLLAGLTPQERNDADPLAVLAAVAHFKETDRAPARLENIFKAIDNAELELFEAQMLIIKLATVALPYPELTANFLEKKGQELPQMMARLYKQDPEGSVMVLGMIYCLLTTLMEKGNLSASYVKPCIFPIPYTVKFYSSEFNPSIWQDTLISNWADLLCSYQRTFPLALQNEKLLDLFVTLTHQSGKYNQKIYTTKYYRFLADELARRRNEMNHDLSSIDEIIMEEPEPKRRKVLPQPIVNYQDEQTLINLARVQNWYVVIENDQGEFLRAYNPMGQIISSAEAVDPDRVEKSTHTQQVYSLCILRQRQHAVGEGEVYYDAVNEQGNVIPCENDDYNILRSALTAVNSNEPTNETINQLIHDLHPTR
ncbi:hypothetical protein SC206_02780 [Rouxiella sp. T17]|uniref:hypothetical protein n=1 Tax=Rouxiella sp. T17 TaxID=3085684 RepID=UPI002FC9F1DA